MDLPDQEAEKGMAPPGSGSSECSESPGRNVEALGELPGAGLSGERIGLFGGTFDPPHLGHLAAAIAARNALSLDRVLLVVANCPWQKVALQAVTPAEDRLDMVKAAVEHEPGLEADGSEIGRGGPSYTVDTVEALVTEARRRGRNDPDIFLLVGSDVVPGLSTWERVDTLRRMVTLVAVGRPGAPIGEPPSGWRFLAVDGDDVDVSSSQVKDRLQHGLPVEGLVPPSVIRCIRLRHLYAGDR